MRVYRDQLTLELLKMHGDSAVERKAGLEMPAEVFNEIRERLVRKLQRTKNRDEQTQTQS